ncbi:hypothetical protein P8452_49562 [Trifolium repens]|nr:hypothetical protein P8452_49562 [Trifolium repens]
MLHPLTTQVVTIYMAKKATCHTHNHLEENLRWTTCQKPYLKWEKFLYLLSFLTYVQIGPTTHHTRPGPANGKPKGKAPICLDSPIDRLPPTGFYVKLKCRRQGIFRQIRFFSADFRDGVLGSPLKWSFLV